MKIKAGKYDEIILKIVFSICIIAVIINFIKSNEQIIFKELSVIYGSILILILSRIDFKSKSKTTK